MKLTEISVRALAVGVGGLFIAALLPTGAEAIPAWARRYDMDCSACHWGATNKLTKFGRDFLLRGLRTADDPGIEDQTELNLAHYMSVRTRFSYTADKDATPTTTFQYQAFNVFVGGPLYENFSIFGTYSIHTTPGFSQGYLEYGTNHESDTYQSFRVGRVGMTAGHSNMFLTRPMTLFTNVGGSNSWTPNTKSDGIAAVIRPTTNTMFELGYVNGVPVGNDLNESRDVWASVEHWLDDQGSKVIAYWASGRARVTGPPAWEQDFTRFGVNAMIVRENWTIGGSWMSGRNDLSSGGHREPTGYALEFGYNFNPNLTGYISYEDFDRDLASSPRVKQYSLALRSRLHQIGSATMSFTSSKPDGGSRTNVLSFSLDFNF